MKIAFWNTRLMRKGEENPEYQSEIIRIIIDMMAQDSEQAIDIMFLCEVDERFYSNQDIIGIFNHFGLSISPASTSNSGKQSKYDMCAISKPSNFKVELESQLLYNDLDDGNPRTGNNTRVGAKYRVMNADGILEFYVIASHWPSKMSIGYEFKHMDAAEVIRREVCDTVRNGSQIILLGDYNRTPHEIIHSTNLKSYNNKYYVLRNSGRLYNLSFYFTNQHTECGINNSNKVLQHGFGTFVSASSRISELGCAVFDHAHVSSDFIKNGPWIVNESETKIVFNQDVIDLMYSKDAILDHLPISIEVNKND